MKMVEADGFKFVFNDAIDAFIFDEKDKNKPEFHGLSHAMKAVDIIVELEETYLFIEVKNFHDPASYHDSESFNYLRESLKYKYRDTYLYRLAEKKLDKPVRYLCLLTLENPLISRMNKEMRIQLPVGMPVARWKDTLVDTCAVLNVERWNHNFPKWPVQLL